MEPLPDLEDDGLHVGEVGDWAERKYRLIAYYAGMFATAGRLLFELHKQDIEFIAALPMRGAA